MEASDHGAVAGVLRLSVGATGVATRYKQKLRDRRVFLCLKTATEGPGASLIDS